VHEVRQDAEIALDVDLARVGFRDKVADHDPGDDVLGDVGAVLGCDVEPRVDYMGGAFILEECC
jgi:hypothetical protein